MLHVAAVWLGRGRYQLAVRADRHGVHRGPRGGLPVGRAPGTQAPSEAAVADRADHHVPARPAGHRPGYAERDRDLRRHAVLGPHDPAPDAYHGRAAAARLRAAGEAAAAREQEPAAHVGEEDRQVEAGAVDYPVSYT